MALSAYSPAAAPASPTDMDRNVALRHALIRIAALVQGAAPGVRADIFTIAIEALEADKDADEAQDAANEADMRRQDDALRERAYGWQPSGFITEL